VQVRGRKAEAHLCRLVGFRAFLGARGAGAAPLHVEQHQQVLATGLPRVLAESQLPGGLALLQQVDGLAQRLRELFEIEVAQVWLRLQSRSEHHASGIGEIDRERGNRAGRKRLRSEPDQSRPALEPARDERHLPHRKRIRVGELGEQHLNVALGAARVRLALREAVLDAYARKAVALGERIEFVQRAPQRARRLPVDVVVVE